MHKLMEYINDELKSLERKAENGKLSMAEIQYGDTLAHFEKSLLASEAMKDSDYSRDYSRDYGRDYSRDGYAYDRRRDSMGRYMPYSRDEAKEDLKTQLKDMERSAKDDESRRMIKHWIKQMEEQ